MKNETSKKKEAIESYTMAGGMHPIVGRLAKSEQPGIILVEHNGLDPKPARIVAGLKRQELSKKENIGRDVLILFEGGNPEYPIIIGLLESLIDDLVSMEIEQKIEREESKTNEQLDTIVDGKRIVLEAEDEIVLKCGKGSITLNKDGKIIVKGTNLISRASETNKIKGSSIDLN